MPSTPEAGGGGDGWQRTRNIKFLTIATTGNDSQFGELIRSGDTGGTPDNEGYRYWAGFASPTRAVFAGGDTAIRKSVEYAEDSKEQGWKDLKANDISQKDIVVGIAASGTTPYVVGGLKDCQENNISTACIVCNENSPLSEYADFKIEVIVGPEFLKGLHTTAIM